jgi:peptide/nickel transport system substrate-binding protein
MRRRSLLGVAAAALAAPRIARSQAARPLRFVPHANLSVVDPVASTAYITRNHGFLVWDTLYALDEGYTPRPQMVAGESVEDEGRRWTFTLREGLRFHDGEPVRAEDVIVSLARWAKRDAFGSRLAALAEEMAALDDRRFAIRLKRPFAHMRAALGKPGSLAPFIMPARIAARDPFQPFGPGEVIGSGPFRFRADELVPGARVVYERFEGYVPREEPPSFLAGGKRARISRVEWTIIPDPATAAAALRSGEVHWWERVTPDLLPALRREAAVAVEIPDPLGFISTLRVNHLQPPFDNPALRRALLPAVNQADFMQAVMGTDRSLWRTGVGVFTPGTPLASEAGLEAMRFDLERARRAVAASGYRGEPVVVLVATDVPAIAALSAVGIDMLRKIGLVVEEQAMDWGSVVRRLGSREPPSRGGWSAYFSNWAGLDHIDPAGHLVLRGNGAQGFVGWPDSPELERLRDAWFEAPDLASQQAIARAMQERAMIDVPYVPLGQFFQPMAYRRSLRGVAQPGGIPRFWNVEMT